jgi:hypothetical protein
MVCTKCGKEAYQVSLSLEINANATFSQMEAQIQEAGHRPENAGPTQIQVLPPD